MISRYDDDLDDEEYYEPKEDEIYEYEIVEVTAVEEKRKKIKNLPEVPAPHIPGKGKWFEVEEDEEESETEE